MFRLVYLGVAIFCAVMMVSGCGGGGGGMIMADMPPSEIMPGPSPDTSMQTAFVGSSNRDTLPLSRAASRIADSIRQEQKDAIFGSVAQTRTGLGLAGPTGIETTFNGQRYTLSINRRDGSSTTLNTSRDIVADVVERSPAENPVTDRNWVDGYIYKSNESELTAAGVAVEWSSADFTDYASGGYWMHIDFTQQYGFEIGAFIDGPEFDRTVDLPLTGTASYDGRASGLYVGVNGGDFPTVPAGTIEQGEYDGRLVLVANFETNRIGGKVDNIGVYNILAVTPNGDVSYNPSLTNTAYELILPVAQIQEAGRFAGGSPIVIHPQIPIRSSTGAWAGTFSSVEDSNGNPRSVAGTNSVYATTFGGSEVAIIGAFYGATEQFE